MPQQLTFNPRYEIKDFPKIGSELKEDINFWNTLDSPHFKNSTLFILLNTVRMADPANLTNDQCRTQLSKIHAMTQLIDFKQILVDNQDEKPVSERDHLPEDH